MSSGLLPANSHRGMGECLVTDARTVAQQEADAIEAEKNKDVVPKTFKQVRKENRKKFAKQQSDAVAATNAARVVVDGLEKHREPTWVKPPAENVIAALEVYKGQEMVGRIPLAGDDVKDPKNVYLFGRHPVCDHVLEHKSISRQHAYIGWDGTGKIAIFDLGAAHGTLVDRRQKLRKGQAVHIGDGATITFGASTRSYVLRVSTREEEEEMEVESIPVQEFHWLCALDVSTTCGENGETSTSDDFFGPPEILRVGAVLLDTSKRGVARVAGSFTGFCTSDDEAIAEHCLSNLGTTQAEVDAAGSLGALLADVGEWLSGLGAFTVPHYRDELIKGTRARFPQGGLQVIALTDTALKRHLPRQCLELEVNVPGYCKEWVNLRQLANVWGTRSGMPVVKRTGNGDVFAESEELVEALLQRLPTSPAEDAAVAMAAKEEADEVAAVEKLQRELEEAAAEEARQAAVAKAEEEAAANMTMSDMLAAAAREEEQEKKQAIADALAAARPAPKVAVADTTKAEEEEKDEEEVDPVANAPAIAVRIALLAQRLIADGCVVSQETIDKNTRAAAASKEDSDKPVQPAMKSRWADDSDGEEGDGGMADKAAALRAQEIIKKAAAAAAAMRAAEAKGDGDADEGDAGERGEEEEKRARSDEEEEGGRKRHKKEKKEKKSKKHKKDKKSKAERGERSREGSRDWDRDRDRGRDRDGDRRSRSRSRDRGRDRDRR